MPLKATSQTLYSEHVPGKGRGVFASRSVNIGDEVLQFLGEVRDVATFKDLTHALQVGPRDFLSASGGIDDFVNHSCDPNCGIRDTDRRVVLFALRPINNGDEITFDYATTQSGGFFLFDCSCGAKICRHHIGDFADVPQARQDFYLKNGAVLEYLKPKAR